MPDTITADFGLFCSAHAGERSAVELIRHPSLGGCASSLSGDAVRTRTIAGPAMPDAPAADIAPGQRLRLLSGNHVRVETIDAAGQRAQCVYVTANGADRAGWRHAEPLDLPLSVLRAGSVVRAGVAA